MVPMQDHSFGQEANLILNSVKLGRLHRQGPQPEADPSLLPSTVDVPGGIIPNEHDPAIGPVTPHQAFKQVDDCVLVTDGGERPMEALERVPDICQDSIELLRGFPRHSRRWRLGDQQRPP